MKKALMVAGLLGFSVAALASDDVYNTVTANTIVSASRADSNSGWKAKDWGLTDAEWASYTKVMNGQAGYYFKQYTPPEVLTMYAENDAELRHFADISASMEHQAVEKELKLNNAFHDAVLRLYPDEPVIKSFDMSSFSPNSQFTPIDSKLLQSGDHLAVFTDASSNDPLIKTLVDRVSSSTGTVLDVYLVNSKSAGQILSWAKNENIPPKLTSTGKITLNNDSGRYARMLISHPLPVVMLVRGQSSRIIDTGSL